MIVWVDADACPAQIKQILFRAAERVQVQTVLVANHAAAADPDKRRAMDDITTLLLGALRAEGRVLWPALGQPEVV